jgi:hypothetical protein
MGTTIQAPPRIIALRFLMADGKERRRTVRCPYYIRDPQASIYGLQARLAALTFDGIITRSSISVPAHPRHLKACHGKCECFRRWTEIEELAA